MSDLQSQMRELKSKKDVHKTASETALSNSDRKGASSEYVAHMQQKYIAHATLAIFYQSEIRARSGR